MTRRVLGPLLVLAVVLVSVSGAGPAGAAAPAASPAPARAATWVGGWPSFSPATVSRGTAVATGIRVASGGHTWPRRVVLQHRAKGGSWQRLAARWTRKDGRAWLGGVPRSSGHLRVFVPATRRAAGRVTPARPVTVTVATTSRADRREARVVRLVNDLRARGTRCGDEWFAPVPAVRSRPRLASASRAYAGRMADLGFFDHLDPHDGSGPGDRATRAGYRWSGIGENIAAGYDTPAAVVEGWRLSEGHCRNMMGRWAHIGVGWHDAGESAAYGQYWVQLFANPR